MKNCKKLIAVILAVMMLAGSLPLMALAAEKTDAVIKIEQAIADFDGNVNIAEPTAEDLAAYQALITAYNALTMSEKESIEDDLFGKFFQANLDRERQVSIAANPTITASNKQHRLNAWDQVKSNITLPSYVQDGIDLRETLDSKTATTAEKKAAFAASSKISKIIAGSWYPGYAFYYDYNKYPVKAFETLVAAISKDLQDENPFTENAPSRLSKPKASDYAGGESDPAYIAAFNAYLDAERAYYAYYARKYDHQYSNNLKAMQVVAEISPEYKNAVDVFVALREAKLAFEADNSVQNPALRAVAAYDALSGDDAFYAANWNISILAIKVDKGTSVTYSIFSTKSIYNACLDISNIGLVDDFVELINSIEQPYTRDDIAAAKAAYAKIPTSLAGTIPAEITAKYAAILASIGPDEPNPEAVYNLESSGYSTDVTYKFPLTKKKVERTAQGLENLLLAILGADDLSDLIAENLYTSSMVGTVINFLYPTMAGLTSLLAVKPSALAAKLTEEKFAGAAAVLNAAGDDWDAVGDFADGDWGFANGDKEGFLDAVAASFRGLSLLTMAVSFENKISTTNGTYDYGAYEKLIPVFEALDLNGIISSHEYTQEIINESSSNVKMDKRIRPILVPIFNLLDEIAADPLDGILNLLPKLAMVVDSGILNKQITEILNSVSLVEIAPPDLTTIGLFNIIEPLLSDIELKAAVIDEDGETILEPAVTLSLKLNEENFAALIKDLAGCGTYVVRANSVMRGYAYRMGINSDKTNAFTVLFNWLYSDLTAKDNITAVKTSIEQLDLGFFETLAIKLLLSSLNKVNAAAALCTLSNLMPIINVAAFFIKLF